MAEVSAKAKLRADKWLWYARVYKTRTLASTSIKTGKVRVNQEKISSPSRAVSPGDVGVMVTPLYAPAEPATGFAVSTPVHFVA